MNFDKNRLKKIHGVTESSGQDDPVVISRRKLHETAARWCEKWLALFHIFFASIGFLFVLLPVLSMPWRSFVERIPVASKIFYDYSTLSGLAMVNFFALIAIFLVKNYFSKYMPGGATQFLTYRDMIRMELYPRTPMGEMAYWSDIFFGVVSVTIPLILPFGVIAYFI